MKKAKRLGNSQT